jgi:hypothetical protein
MPSVRVDLENEFTPTSVKAFFHKVSQLDAERIHGVFAPIATAPPPATAATFNLSMSTALYEVLSNRRLWSDFRIVRVVSKWLAATPEPIKEAAIDKHMILYSCPGLLQWLVSPDPGIRYVFLLLAYAHGLDHGCLTRIVYPMKGVGNIVGRKVWHRRRYVRGELRRSRVDEGAGRMDVHSGKRIVQHVATESRLTKHRGAAHGELLQCTCLMSIGVYNRHVLVVLASFSTSQTV